jgi:hypothetical protein
LAGLDRTLMRSAGTSLLQMHHVAGGKLPSFNPCEDSPERGGQDSCAQRARSFLVATSDTQIKNPRRRHRHGRQPNYVSLNNLPGFVASGCC